MMECLPHAMWFFVNLEDCCLPDATSFFEGPEDYYKDECTHLLHGNRMLLKLYYIRQQRNIRSVANFTLLQSLDVSHASD